MDRWIDTYINIYIYIYIYQRAGIYRYKQLYVIYVIHYIYIYIYIYDKTLCIFISKNENNGISETEGTLEKEIRSHL